ncbi:hypothetical protein [Streptomyces sp. NPDC005181]|uniref:hypothetical protein n=1 Tax=Streptomyces sp. NPDC005181 TaxID=3156869 RepID=UPI0033BF3665
MRRLSGGIVCTVPFDLASGRQPLMRKALDEPPEGKVVEDILSVLAATGALTQRDAQMVRLGRHVKDLVTSQAATAGRKILHLYATWRLLRRRSRGKDVTHTQLAVVRQHRRGAVRNGSCVESPAGAPRTVLWRKRRAHVTVERDHSVHPGQSIPFFQRR